MTQDRSFPDGTHLETTFQADGFTEIALILDGIKVSNTMIVPMRMRVGRAILRMDGIGGVGTDEHHRHRGYSRRVLEAAVDHMRAGDAAITTLYGIPDFYPKYGYATAGAEHTVVVPITEYDQIVPTLPTGWSFRAWKPDDMDAVQRLYHLNTKTATGAVPRPGIDPDVTDPEGSALHAIGSRAWNDLLRVGTEGVVDECRILVDPAGDVAAYAWLGRQGWWVQSRERGAPTSLHIGEPVARDPEAGDVLIAACRAWAREVRPDATHVAFIIPPEGPVAQAAAYLWATHVRQFTRVGEFMARVLDIGRLFEQLLPELSAQVRRSGIAHPTKIAIRTEEGAIALTLDRDNSVSIDPVVTPEHLTIVMPQTMLARLSLGAYAVRDLAARDAPALEPSALDLLEALFPQRALHIYPMDRF